MNRFFKMIACLSLSTQLVTNCGISMDNVIQLNLGSQTVLPFATMLILNAKFDTIAKRIDDQRFIDFVTAEAKLITDQDIKFYKAPLATVMITFPGNRVVVNAAYYDFIIKIFDKISDQGIDALSPQEHADLKTLKFLVQHESAHCKKHHIYKKVIINTIIGGSLWFAYLALRDKIDSTWKRVGALVLFGGISSGLNNAYSRFTEREADSLVAGIEPCEGAVAFFGDLLKLYTPEDNYLMYMLSEGYPTTHPALSERKRTFQDRVQKEYGHCSVE